MKGEKYLFGGLILLSIIFCALASWELSRDGSLSAADLETTTTSNPTYTSPTSGTTTAPTPPSFSAAVSSNPNTSCTKGQTNVQLIAASFTNTSNEPIAINYLEMHGDFYPGDVSDVAVYFNGTTRIASATSTTADMATFSGLSVLIPTGGSITLAVKANITSTTVKSVLSYAFQPSFLARATGATSGITATLSATSGNSSLIVTGGTTATPNTTTSGTTTDGTTTTTTTTSNPASGSTYTSPTSGSTSGTNTSGTTAPTTTAPTPPSLTAVLSPNPITYCTKGQTNVQLIAVAFTNTSNEPVAISDLEIHGDFAARDVYNIGLYFGTTGTTRIASAASTTGDKAVFSGMRMLVPTGGSITLAVKADINSSTAKSALYYAFQYYFLAKATGATSGTAATLNATQGTSSLSVTGRTPTTTTNPTTAPATTTTPGTTPTTTATDTTTTPAATAPTTSANPTTATPTYSPAPTTALSPISTNTSAGSASAPQPVRTAPAPSTTAATVPASALTASPAPALSSDPAALNLNNTANFPLTKNTRGCYSLSTQTAEKVTFQLSGPATRILDATTEPGGIYCCNFTVSDLPNGTYNLSISIYNAGSINTQSRSIVVNKPSAQEALTQNSAAILQGKCQALGITDAQQCRSTVLDQYARDIRCQDLSTTDCHATLKETYADDVIVLEDRYQRIAENVKGSVGKDLRVSELEQVLNRNAPVADIAVPLQDKGIRVKALGAASEIMLDRTQGIVEAAPVAIAIDSDGDSVPDDIEKRLGTDANSADTDGDGYTDSEEVRGGFNPLGEGMKTLGLAPIEEAILKNLPLSHPKTGGVEREALQVSSVTNAPATGSKAEAGAGYVLSGKAVPNSVITLYIYSDIPVVTTVSTDQDGNWQYEFKQALSDGDHEVYVAVNDDTGKVVSKSKPFDFTVKQAKAISPSDLDGLQADAHAVATPSAQTTSGAAYYILLVVGLLIVTSILIFAFLILKKRKLKS